MENFECPIEFAGWKFHKKGICFQIQTKQHVPKSEEYLVNIVLNVTLVDASNETRQKYEACVRTYVSNVDISKNVVTQLYKN